MDNTTRSAYKAIVKELGTEAAAQYAPDGPKATFMKNKAEHFIERFVSRVGDDPALFRKVMKAFLGMLYVRRQYYVDFVAKQPTLTEHVYTYFGYHIHFFTEKGERCVGNDDGSAALIKLATIIKK